MPTWAWVAIAVFVLFLAFMGWACIHVGARSERQYEEARRREQNRRRYGGGGYVGTTDRPSTSTDTFVYVDDTPSRSSGWGWGGDSGSDSGSSGGDSGGSDGGGGGGCD